ncbi:MAG: tandem-95 repeat protein [Mycobacterium sp.]|nr:tandem-95 repeat protein [Mycobacterium sp.]
MGYAQHVGRVGALAVALGIGSALTTTPWVAVAAPDDSSSTAAESPGSDTEKTDSAAGSVGDPKSGDSDKTDTDTSAPDKPSDTESEPEADPTDNTDTAPDTDTAEQPAAHTSDKTAPQRTASHRQTRAPEASAESTTRTVDTDEAAPAGTAPDSEPATPAAASQPVRTPVRTEVIVQQEEPLTVDEPAPAPTEVRAVGLASLLAPLLDPGPGGVPLQSPAEWALLAWARRQLGTDTQEQTEADDEPTVSLMARSITVSAETNTEPVIDGVSTDDPTPDGYVFGEVSASDADGDTLSYAITDPPLRGIVTIGEFSGTYWYTPNSQAQHAAAADGAGTDATTDTFTVTVSDGQGGTAEREITVAIRPTNTTPIPGSVSVHDIDIDGSKVVYSPDSAHAYTVVHDHTDDSWHLAVIDTHTNSVTSVPVDRAYINLVITPDGAHVYGINAGGDAAVLAYDTASATAVGITLGGTVIGTALAADNGGYLVTTMSADGYVLNIIDAATNEVLPVTIPGERDVYSLNPLVTSDGTVYVASRQPTGNPGSYTWLLSTVDPDTGAIATTTRPSSGSQQAPRVVVSADGSHSAINVGGLTVVDTATGARTVFADVPTTALVVLSPDGRYAYYASGSTLTTIDTSTATVSTTTVAGAHATGLWNPTPDGRYAFTDGGYIDLVGHTYTAVNYTGFSQYTILVTADSTRAFGSYADGTTYGIAIIQLPTGTTTFIPADTYPEAVSPDGRYVYGVGYFSNELVIVDTQQGTATTLPTRGELSFSDLTFSPDGQHLVMPVWLSSDHSVLLSIDLPPAPATGYRTDDPDPITGVVTGAIDFTDDDGDTLTYSVSSGPSAGSVTVDSATGAFTYTPTSAGAGDHFNVLLTDGHGAQILVTVDVPGALPNNAPVAGPPTIGSPSTVNGSITGFVTATDPDGDTVTYALSDGPALGGFTIDPQTGAWHYAPNPDARHAAAADGAPAITDSVRIVVSDGRGGTDTVVIPLAVSPANAAPTGVPSHGAATPATGAVSGSLNVIDPDGDALTYTVSANPAKGALILNTDGTFTYTPTAAARQNAGAGATDAFSVIATDGHGASTTLDVTVPVAPPPAATNPVTALLNKIQQTLFNQSPTATPVQITQLASGVILGTVGASDPEDDPLVYTVTKGPTKGTVVVSADGSYTYTPNPALANSGGDDSFTVTVTEANASAHIHGTQGLLAKLVSSLTGGRVTLPDGSSISVAVPVHVTQVTGGTIPAVTGSPQWLAFNAAGTRAYVVNQAGNTVTVFDTTTRAVVGTVVVGGAPTMIAGLPDSNLLYLTNRDSNSVSVLDTTTDTVVATIGVGAGPLQLGFSPDGATAYVTNGAGDSVSVIDTATRAVVGSFGVGDQPAGVTVRPDGQFVYVANQLSRTVSVFNRSTGALVADIPMGAHPTVITFNRSGSLAYVSSEFSDKLYVVDTATNTVVGSVNVGTTPIDVVLSADGSRLYVTNFSGRTPSSINPGTVSVVDTATNAVIDTIAVGYGPVGAAITPNGSALWVVNSGGSISVITLGGGGPVSV